MKTQSGFEVVRQARPSLLFPDEKVSKQKFLVALFETEQEAKTFMQTKVSSLLFPEKYEIRKRTFRWLKKSGFTREGIPVHHIEVKETISLVTLPQV